MEGGRDSGWGSAVMCSETLIHHRSPAPRHLKHRQLPPASPLLTRETQSPGSAPVSRFFLYNSPAAGKRSALPLQSSHRQMPDSDAENAPHRKSPPALRPRSSDSVVPFSGKPPSPSPHAGSRYSRRSVKAPASGDRFLQILHPSDG